MKRASYRHAIEWIALNDGGGDEMDEVQCGELVTAKLVADVFGVPDERVGRDIDRARKKLNALRVEGTPRTGHHT